MFKGSFVCIIKGDEAYRYSLTIFYSCINDRERERESQRHKKNGRSHRRLACFLLRASYKGAEQFRVPYESSSGRPSEHTYICAFETLDLASADYKEYGVKECGGGG